MDKCSENVGLSELHRRALELLKDGELESACHLLERLTRQEPENGYAHNDLASVYCALKLFDDAEQSIRAAYQYLPLDLTVLRNCAHIYFERGQFGLASIFYSRVLALCPTDSNAHQKLSVIHERQAPISQFLDDSTRASIKKRIARPRILLIADVPGWIFERHCRTLRALLVDEFDCCIAFRGETYCEDEFDLIFPLEWNLVTEAQIRNPQKYITAIRSHISWENEDFESFIAYLNRSFRSVHVVSKRLHDIFVGKVHSLQYVTHGIDLDHFTPNRIESSVPRKLRVGWCGNRQSPMKGFAEFIAPLQSLPGIELVYCGYADRLLSQEEMCDFYNSIDVYVCASKLEGNNNALLEAAAMEVAIVTTDNGTVPEYLVNEVNALIVPREKESFTQAVLRLRDDRNLARRLGAAARRAVHPHWGWSERVREYRDSFWAALARPSLEPATRFGVRVSRIPTPQRVNIAILTFNALEKTKICIEKLLKNTSVPCNIFVLDNASRDETPQWLSSISNENVFIELGTRNLGVPGGRNRLLEIISPHLPDDGFIVFLDNDIEVLPGWAETYLSFFADHPEVGIASAEGHRMCVFERDRTLFRHALYTSSVDVAAGGFGCWVRSAVFKTIGGYDENLGLFWHEDDDLCVRAIAAGFDCYVLPHVPLLHREHSSGVALPDVGVGGSPKNQEYLARKWRELGLVTETGMIDRSRLRKQSLRDPLLSRNLGGYQFFADGARICVPATILDAPTRVSFEVTFLPSDVAPHIQVIVDDTVRADLLPSEGTFTFPVTIDLDASWSDVEIVLRSEIDRAPIEMCGFYADGLDSCWAGTIRNIAFHRLSGHPNTAHSDVQVLPRERKRGVLWLSPLFDTSAFSRAEREILTKLEDSGVPVACRSWNLAELSGPGILLSDYQRWSRRLRTRLSGGVCVFSVPSLDSAGSEALQAMSRLPSSFTRVAYLPFAHQQKAEEINAVAAMCDEIWVGDTTAREKLDHPEKVQVVPLHGATPCPGSGVDAGHIPCVMAVCSPSDNWQSLIEAAASQTCQPMSVLFISHEALRWKFEKAVLEFVSRISNTSLTGVQIFDCTQPPEVFSLALNTAAMFVRVSGSEEERLWAEEAQNLGLPVISLSDFSRALPQHLAHAGQKSGTINYGRTASDTAGTIAARIKELGEKETVSRLPQRSRLIAVDARTLLYGGSTSRGIGLYTINHLQEVIRQTPEWNYVFCFEQSQVPGVHDAMAPFSQFENVSVQNIDSMQGAECDLFHIPDPMMMHPGFDSPFRLFSQVPRSCIFYDLTPIRCREFYYDQWEEYLRSAYQSRLNQLRDSTVSVFAISECSKQDLAELAAVDPNRITVIHGGLNVPLENTGKDREILQRLNVRSPFFLTVGHVDPHKGFDVAFHAFAGLPADHVQLFVVGSRQDWRKLEFQRVAAEANLHNIVFPGFVSNEELGALYRSATALLYPSYYEGFGLPILEAMANECPVITTNVSSIPEVAGDAAYYVPVNDVAALRSAMTTMLLSPELRNTFIARGKERAKLFSWKTCARKTVEGWKTIFGTQCADTRTVPWPGRSPRVLIFHRPNISSNPGGDSIVSERLVNGLRARGVHVEVSTDGNADPRKYDVVQLFNFATREMTESFARRCVDAGVPFCVNTMYEDWTRFHAPMVLSYRVMEHYVQSGQPIESWPQYATGFQNAQPSPIWDNTFAASHAAVLMASGAEEARVLRRDYPFARVRTCLYGHEMPRENDGGALFRQRTGLTDYILCVGRLETRKNQLLLLKALEESPRTLVLATGGFSYQQPYADLCKAFRRRGRTVFLDRLSPEVLGSAYAGADAHVLPSWYELPGLVSLEAAAYGVPIVVSDYGTVRDYVGEFAHYCDPLRPETIAASVEAACGSRRSPELIERLRARTWDQYVESVLALYEEVLNSRASVSNTSNSLAVPLASFGLGPS